MGGFKFRVLLDSKERTEVFRDIVIADTANMEDFYNICIQSFDFKGNQMASFYLSDQEWNKGTEITLEDMGFDEQTLVMKQVKLHQIVTDPKQRLLLVYDFISMWIFMIELVATLDQTPKNASVTLSVGVAPIEEQTDSNFDDLNFETIPEYADDNSSFEAMDEDDFDDFDMRDNSYFESYDDMQDY